MITIILNGAPASGKSTFASMCKEILGDQNCKEISTVDCVKMVAKSYGWDGTKDNESRKHLSNIKAAMAYFGDIPFHDVELSRESYEDKGVKLLFINSREADEIYRMKGAWDNTYSLIVRNPKAENKEVSNASDANVLDCVYDYYIDNHRTLDELKENAKVFLIDLGLI